MRSRIFRLDRQNGKVMGLFAGLASQTGYEAKTMRIVFLSLAGVMTLTGGWQWMIIGYFGAAWLINRAAKKRDGNSQILSGGSIHDLRTGMTETDHRLAEIERYVASPNARLAREIDELR